MRVTDDIKQLIVERAPHETIRALAVEQGMRTLQDQALRLVTEDESTLAEVLRTVQVV
jgi:type IV pilus assembly protein PilB